MTTSEIKLYGRVIVKGEIHALTGLHIGGSPSGLEIGGVDMQVIRDAFDRPYIPGSSLKGKMRSLWEKWNSAPQNWEIGKGVRIHICSDKDAYDDCRVCPIYGTMGQSDASAPTRVTVRDVGLDTKSLAEAVLDQPYAEVKWEASIDRITSAAVPRQMERVPAGAIFRISEKDPAELLVFSFYEAADVQRFGDLLTAMQLLEDDYLGGQGTRGSGKIVFKKLEVICKGVDYDKPVRVGEGEILQNLLDIKNEMAGKIREMMKFPEKSK